MAGTAQAIVMLWLFPVTVFIIIPLLLLCGWSLFSISQALRPNRSIELEESEFELEEKSLAQTGA